MYVGIGLAAGILGFVGTALFRKILRRKKPGK